MQERKPASGWCRGLAVLPAVAAGLLPGVT